MREFVESLAKGEGNFYDGWMKNPMSAMISCNDGFRPAIRIIPIIQLPTWMWIWVGVLVAIKIVNQISALIVSKRFCFPHTKANIPIVFVAGIATYTAIQEGNIIRIRRD